MSSARFPRASYARQAVVLASPARLTQGTIAENLHLRLGGELTADRTDALAVFERVELCEDLFQLGLRTTIDAARHGALVDAVLAARERLRARLQETDYAGLIEPFERDRYLQNATLGENLIFGVPMVPEFQGPALARNRFVRRVLREVELEERLIALGWEAWGNLAELFADLPRASPVLRQLQPDPPGGAAALPPASGGGGRRAAREADARAPEPAARSRAQPRARRAIAWPTCPKRWSRSCCGLGSCSRRSCLRMRRTRSSSSSRGATSPRSACATI